MMQSPQFKHFGIRPEWRPGEGDIEGFCHDEVVRQWHDPRVEYDGGCRVTWMMHGWDYATNHAQADPDLPDIRILGQCIEQKENALGFRLGNVWVGNRKGAPPGHIDDLITKLAEMAPTVVAGVATSDVIAKLDYARRRNGEFFDLPSVIEAIEHLVVTVDDFYLTYEWIHPFGDGNGRTGKILHNWLNDSLYEPVLVSDYFGGGNP